MSATSVTRTLTRAAWSEGRNHTRQDRIGDFVGRSALIRRHAVSRRELLELGLLGGVGALLPEHAARAAQDPGPVGRPTSGPTDGEAEARNVIFAVADGMSAGVLALAEAFSRLVRDQGTCWYELVGDSRLTHGWFDMRSLNSLVTDSSAAASAWGSGSLIFNDAVNTLPDGTALTPIAELVRATGRRVGLVTTTTVTHATPAGFAAAERRRDDQEDIAPQYKDRVDVILGGGREYFAPSLRGDRRDLIGEYRRSGYTFWSRRQELLDADPPARVLGLFGTGHLPFTVDHRNQASTAAAVPTLAEMTRAALAVLGKSPRGFLLQVEGGRVDHAAHNNDAGALLWEQLAFDDALRVVMEFAERQPGTLVIITTDHGNANPGLNGMGARYTESDQCFERLALTTASYEHMRADLRRGLPEGQAPPLEQVIQIAKAGTGAQLSPAQAEALGGALGAAPKGILNQQHASFVGVMGQVLSNITGIGWTGTTHTSDLALLTARGPGATRLAGVHGAPYAFGCLTAALGIRFRNPCMSPQEARRYAHVRRAVHLDAYA
jgi:alkaline phosphatase